MDYSNLYKLCKRISQHIEMIVHVDRETEAWKKLKSEIDADYIELLKLSSK